MQRNRFEHLKAELVTASAAQILELEDAIGHVVAEQFVEMALARRTKAVTENRCCPHCKSNDVVRHGTDLNRRQRFRCRSCKRTYNILTGTQMARARKPATWGVYLGYMTDHCTVRAIGQAGIGLNHVTIWRWRHRFLRAAANDNAALLRGVIEVDQTVFARSVKGSRGANKSTPPKPPIAAAGPSIESRRPDQQVPVLTALDSSGGLVQAVLTATRQIETVLHGRIAFGSVLCTAGHSVYARIAERAASELRVIRDGIVGNLAGSAPARLGLKRVRAHHQHLRHLINERCRGVATRYLRNYLAWHREMVRPGFAARTLLTRALA